MTKDEFLQTPRTNNQDYITERILLSFTNDEIKDLNSKVDTLYTNLLKSWAVDMPFEEIRYAINLADDIVHHTELIYQEEEPKMHQQAEQAAVLLRGVETAADEDKIPLIKSAFDLLKEIPDEDCEYTEELDSLINLGRKILVTEIEKELKKAIEDRTFPNYQNACTLFYEYNDGWMEYRGLDSLWSAANEMFLVSAQITIRLYDNESCVIYEKDFDIKEEGFKAFKSLVTILEAYPMDDIDKLGEWQPGGAKRPNFICDLTYFDHAKSAFVEDVQFFKKIPIAMLDFK